MKLLKIIVILIPLLSAPGFILAGDYKSYKSDEEAYAYGFRVGYNQGVADCSSRVSFNIQRHSRGGVYYSGGVYYNSHNNTDFRKGYEEGYTDGFYRETGSRKFVSITNYDPQTFRVAYREGFRNGLMDRETGLDFNYNRDHKSEIAIAYRSYADPQQSGYAQGYKQGYYGASLDDGYSLRTSYVTAVSQSTGFITAFTDDNFEGKMRDFNVGRYSDLDGDWDDSIDSIQIHGNVRVILFEDDDFEGKQLVIERHTPDLDDFNFDDKAGSMIIEPLL